MLLAVAAIPIAILIGNAMRRRRTDRLRAEFGPDYDIAVNEHGSEIRAEKALLERLRQRRAAEGHHAERPR